MSQEFEAAAADSLTSFFRRRRKAAHALPIGTPCANCTTPLQGPWCYNCGQLGEDFHRSIWHLIVEAFEGLFHFDSRLWITLPALFRDPGRLTREYLEGHRAPQIPPLRLFLVVLLLVFFTGSVTGGPRATSTTTDDHGKVVARKVVTLKELEKLTPEQKAKVEQALDEKKVNVSFNGTRDEAASAWLAKRLKKAVEDPEKLTLIMEQWSERFAFLMLPLATLMLSVLFVFQRRFYIFDHTIFALHSLSATGLVLSGSFLLHPLIGSFNQLLWLALPVHLFVHMRGVYRTSVVGTLFRMFCLFVGSVIGFVFIMIGLVWVALDALGA